ncbi:MAG: DUF3021 family protein [Clostridia bacterium]|nr:DUF3021 family protein [Clostridia bacterium]
MQKLWHILRRGMVYETGILVIFYLFSFVLPLEQPGIGAVYFFLILTFSMILSLAQELFSVQRLPLLARYALHFAALLTSFILLYIVTGNYAQRGPSSFFVAIVLFAFGYVIVALPIALIRGKMKAKKQKSTPSTYQKIYR